MGFQDTASYILFTNPVSSFATSCVSGAATTIRDYIVPPTKITQIMMPIPLWKLAAASGPYIKIAALSGAAAVSLGAYGAHKKYPNEVGLEQKQVFETASRYHFFHTLALFGLPMCRHPFLAATFFISGILMFSGTCYYHAFTGDKSYNKVTPFGGVCLIMGWLAMCI